MKAQIEKDCILSAIRENFNEEIYLVGGAVRDFLNNNKITDRDLLVLNSDVKDLSKRLAKFFNATFIELDATNQIYRLVLKDKINYLDITKPLNNSLKEDLTHRDLTINSIAVNLKTFEIIDPTGGLADFNNKILRCYNESSITNDPLRLLRFFRFQAIYGFKIEAQTLEWTKKYKNLLTKPLLTICPIELVSD